MRLSRTLALLDETQQLLAEQFGVQFSLAASRKCIHSWTGNDGNTFKLAARQ